MESTVIQVANQKDQGVPLQKEGGKQGISPSSFYQRASSQPTSPSVTTTKNDPPLLVLRQLQPETKLGQLATQYLYGQFGPLWCSMDFRPYQSSLANSHILDPQASIFIFGPGGSLCLPALIIGFGPTLFIRGVLAQMAFLGHLGPLRPLRPMGRGLRSIGQLGPFWPNPMRPKGKTTSPKPQLGPPEPNLAPKWP
ncbi:hypothetical protein O181_118032 [Austropuccinia psidii MF-1]|uniref:Uncharacterized protein n=1 Tax=Austropuccinia psidii MF-1 TaxID=1389203 RepID=A0A9Q3Q002_9BASI|nr:hypothetical protein [Austropuccinia psidii MF-1]